jgi:hypothetical protein
VADWSPYTGSLIWPLKSFEARRQNRLAEFVRPHLDPNEHIIEILSRVFERLTTSAWRGVVAVVVTSQRLFVVRNMVLLRRMKILVTYPRGGVTVEWNPDAGSLSTQYRTFWFGRLRLAGSVGPQELWVGRRWRQDHAASIALLLKHDGEL